MTNKERKNWKGIIDSMGYYQMTKRWDNKIVAHPIFQDEILTKYFKTRMDKLAEAEETKETEETVQRRVKEVLQTGTYN